MPTARTTGTAHRDALPSAACANYHLPTDLPEHVDYRTVAEAVAVTEALAREVARG